MSFRIDNIGWDLQPNHDFLTWADYFFANQPTYHAQFSIPGAQYDYYLQLASKLQPVYYAANQNADGTTKLPTDPTFAATPATEDVARMMHDFYYPIYRNSPSTTAQPVSGTAPGLL